MRFDIINLSLLIHYYISNSVRMSKHYKLRINVIENNFQVALDKIFELKGI